MANSVSIVGAVETPGARIRYVPLPTLVKFIGLAVVGATVVAATSYVNDMPTRANVRRTITAKSPSEMRVKQVVAFEKLQLVMETVSRSRAKTPFVPSSVAQRNQLVEGTPEETALFKQYEDAIQEIRSEQLSPRNQNTLPAGEWSRLHAKYSADQAFDQFLEDRLIAPSVKAEFSNALTILTERRDKKQQENARVAAVMGPIVRFLVLRLPAMLIGATMLFGGLVSFRSGKKRTEIINRSVFEHTNQYGVVVFGNFDDSVRLKKSGYWAALRMYFGITGMIVGTLVLLIASL